MSMLLLKMLVHHLQKYMVYSVCIQNTVAFMKPVVINNIISLITQLGQKSQPSLCSLISLIPQI